VLTLEQARALVLEAASTLPPPTIETLRLEDAVGRVLAESVVAPRAVPGFACSAMDGYALRLADLVQSGDATLREDGATLAGATEVAPLQPRACRRITTGAPIPEGADTVVMHERTRRVEHSAGDVRIEFQALPETGANIRAASDDFAAGYTALVDGERLDAVAIAAAVSLGFNRVRVRDAPRVAVLTTGDELLPAGAEWRHGLRYDSNGPLLEGLLGNCGFRAVQRGHVRDDPDAVRTALRSAVSAHSLVLVTGGVSAGEADHLPALCRELGAVLFWKLHFRPGMPALLARIGDSLVFGLPGNPVSVLATFVALVRPVLARWMRCPALDPPATLARLDGPVWKRHDRLEWRRGTLRIDSLGVARVTPHASLSSGAQRSLLESNVLLELAADSCEFDTDSLVPVRRWNLS